MLTAMDICREIPPMHSGDIAFTRVNDVNKASSYRCGWRGGGTTVSRSSDRDKNVQKNIQTTGMSPQIDKYIYANVHKRTHTHTPKHVALSHTMINPTLLVVTSLWQPDPVRGCVKRILHGTRFALSANKPTDAAAGQSVRNILTRITNVWQETRSCWY